MKRYDDYVVVVPYTNEKILVQKQFKPGIQEACYGFPAGFVKSTEDTKKAADRELLEETGLRGGMEKVGEFYDNVAVGKEKFTIFFVKNPVGKLSSENPDTTESKIDNIWLKIEDLEKINMPGSCMALAKSMFLRNSNN